MTIQDFLRLTRVNLAVILLCTVLGGVLGFGYAQTQPKTYQATAGALVVTGADGFTSNSVAQQKASAFASLAGSASVADRIKASLGLDSLDASVSGGADANVPIIRLTATSSDPGRARDVANAAVTALGEEITSLESISAGDPQTTTSTDENGTTTTTTSGAATSATTLTATEPAGLPGAPVSPNIKKLTLMGLAAGLVLGYVIAFLRRALDNKVRHNSDVEDLLHSSVLAVVPRSPELNAKGRKHVDGLGQAAEALRHLRTNLRFVDVDNPPRAIVMTSANPGEGKSTVSAVLAQMLAASGQRTILVDTDLRKPVIHKIFDIDGAVGLTQVLAGDVQVSDVAQAVSDHPHLRVIPAGRIPPNPSELLGSQRMKALLDRLSQEAIVILDAPPLLPVTDAGLLTALADGAILVLEVGRTYKEQARLCGKVLTQVDGRLLGVVLNRASRRALGSVYYGYGYGNYGQSYYYYEGRSSKILGFIPRRRKRRGAEIESLPEAHVTLDEPTAPAVVPDRAAGPARRRSAAPATGAAPVPARAALSQPVEPAEDLAPPAGEPQRAATPASGTHGTHASARAAGGTGGPDAPSIPVDVTIPSRRSLRRQGNEG